MASTSLDDLMNMSICELLNLARESAASLATPKVRREFLQEIQIREREWREGEGVENEFRQFLLGFNFAILR